MVKDIQLRVDLGFQENIEYLKNLAAERLDIGVKEISSVQLLKVSLDSRSFKAVYDVNLRVFTFPDSYSKDSLDSDFKKIKPLEKNSKSVLICGFGPAGIFAALDLVKAGIRPVIFERGSTVSERKRDVAILSSQGILNTESNYCFGEGGAGCFSDGKLYTRSNKRGDINKVLQSFISFGAEPSIVYLNHPHLGSDKLPKIVEKIRLFLIEKGAEFHFNTCVDDFIIRDKKCIGLIDNLGNEHFGDAVILACGHSATNIYDWFFKNNYMLEPKSFAMGVRLEHSQEHINSLQYRDKKGLPPAEYSFVTQVGRRGVFSFCMCPGGMVIPSMTGDNEHLVNGMSGSLRASKWANAGMVVGVNVTDYAAKDALSGLRYQQSLEREFYELSKSKMAPAQRMDDFVNAKESVDLPKTSYPLGIFSAPMHKLLPDFIANPLRVAFKAFDAKRKGFLTNDAIILGLESRTSSPIRISRDLDTLEHTQIENLYPCGEGAGYSGGITSSAIDGINSVQQIIKKLL